MDRIVKYILDINIEKKGKVASICDDWVDFMGGIARIILSHSSQDIVNEVG